jgi:hypothetical protein
MTTLQARRMMGMPLFAALLGASGLALAQQGGPATYPVPEPAPVYNNGAAGNSAAPWQNVVPEPGVVVSGDGTPAAPVGYPGYPHAVYPAAYPAPVYPAPVYVAPAYGYYPQPYVYPPIGLSLNLGYSYYHGGGGYGWRGWRGWH